MKIGWECIPSFISERCRLDHTSKELDSHTAAKCFSSQHCRAKKFYSAKFLEPEFWDNAQSDSFCDVCWCWCNQSGLLERRLPLGIGNTKIGIGDEWGWMRNIEIIGHKRKCDHFPESKQKQLSLVHKTFQLNFYPIWNRNCFLSVLSKV